MKTKVTDLKKQIVDMIVSAVRRNKKGLTRKEISVRVLNKIIKIQEKDSSFGYELLLEFRDIGWLVGDARRSKRIVSNLNAKCSHGAGRLGNKAIYTIAS